MTDVEGIRYTFLVDWYDGEASILRSFYLFYFPVDDTIELFDIKNHRTFLKRTKCQGVHLKDINIGGIIKIFSRPMTVKEYGDEYTRKTLGLQKQKTFAMLKPEVIDKAGEIFNMILQNGFKITKLKMAQMTKEHALDFYKEHQGKSFLPFLVEYLTSGPVVAMELVADNAIVKWRQFLGPTDSVVARQEAPDSLRAKYGKDKSHNAAHGSDSVEAADRELAIFFPNTRLQPHYVAPKSTATFVNCTCCIIKPHAVQDGLLGNIIEAIQENGFKVSAMQMYYMEQAHAEEFYEVYKGVVPEYAGMVGHLVSGACVALEIVGDGADTTTKFRALVGPADPEIAKQLRPSTLRAKFGKTKLYNALHCTDLPDDGLLENCSTVLIVSTRATENAVASDRSLVSDGLATPALYQFLNYIVPFFSFIKLIVPYLL